MKKKGFTLIELLAVILILGIIALIAIPTITKILEESRRGVFNTTVKEIDKVIEEQCQREIINDKEITKYYKIKNGKSSKKIDVRGKLPDNGYIFVNDNCDVKFGLNDNKYEAIKFKDEINVTNCNNGLCTKTNNNLKYSDSLQDINNAIDLWISNNSKYLPTNDNNSIIIYSDILKRNNLISSNYKLAGTDKCYGYFSIKIYKYNNSYIYNYDIGNENYFNNTTYY